MLEFEWGISWEYNMNGVGVRVGHDMEVEWGMIYS